MDSFAKLYFHVIFEIRPPGMPDTKLIKGALDPWTERQGGTALAYSIRPDHVHLLINLRPHISLSSWARQAKTQSSKWLGRKSNNWPGWCNGYLDMTVGETDLPRFKRFLLRQDAFHASRTWAEERKSILQAYGESEDEPSFSDRTFAWICIHLTFGTKHRFPLIQGPVEKPLFSKLRQLAEQSRAQTLEINGAQDHVHMVVNIHQSVAISDLVRSLKNESGPWIRRRFTDEFLAWQIGFGAFSVSRSGLEKIRRYVRGQKEHHEIQDS